MNSRIVIAALILLFALAVSDVNVTGSVDAAGSIVGKAMERFESGTGVITALVMLG